MFAVRKITLSPKTFQKVNVIGYKILSAECQGDNIVVYHTFETNHADICEYEFLLLGTGHKTEEDIDCDFEFLNTVKMYDGQLMFHVFYRKIS